MIHTFPGCLPPALLLACTAVFAVPAAAQPTEQGTPSSSITGKVLDFDGSARPGLVVLAYHLSSETLFRSEPTDGKGRFAIESLPYGYVDLAVETDEGVFVGNRVINLAPSSKAALVFTLAPGAPGASGATRDYPGSDRPPQGFAELREKVRGRDFWRSPRGVAILAGAGGLGLLALASEDDSSPFTPPGTLP